MVSFSLGVHEHKRVKSHVGPPVAMASHDGLELRLASQQGKGAPLVTEWGSLCSPSAFLTEAASW